MIRFLERLVGLLLLAAGFVGLVYDGARSIANDTLIVTPVSTVLAALLKDRAGGLQTSIEAVSPMIWTILGLPFTLAPAAILAFAVGAVLLWVGQPPRAGIGFMAGR